MDQDTIALAVQKCLLYRTAAVAPAAVAPADWSAFRGAARRRLVAALLGQEDPKLRGGYLPRALGDRELLSLLEREASRTRVVEALAELRGIDQAEAAELLDRWEATPGSREEDPCDPCRARDPAAPGSALTDAERLVEIRLSSEYPVSRWFGMEILDHAPESVRLGRLVSGAPLLWGHNPDDQIGVIENVSLADRVLRIVGRFSRNERAEAINRDVLDGIVRNASVGYLIHMLRAETLSDDAPDTYRATDWEPLEGSLVSVGADPTAGPGRALEREHVIQIERATPMTDQIETRSAGGTEDDAAALAAREFKDKDRELAVVEADRRKQIRAIAAGYAGNARVQAAALEALDSGTSLPEFQGTVADLLRTPAPELAEKPATEIGLTDTEARGFSLFRWARACLAAREQGKDARELAPFEFEVSEAVEEHVRKVSPRREYHGTLIDGDAPQAVPWTMDQLRHGHPLSIERLEARGVGEQDRRQALRVPHEVQRVWLANAPRSLAERMALRQALGMTFRAPPMDTTENAALVGTDHLAGAFVDALRQMAMIFRAGAVELPGLVGNVSIPRQTGTATFAWVAEDGDSPDTEVPLDAITMTPRTLTGSVPITRRLLLQSAPPVEGIVREDLTLGAAEAIDSASINGAGGDEPTGIRNQTGVQVVTVATPGQPTWREICNFEAALIEQNALRQMASWLVGPNVQAHCKATAKESGDATFLMSEGGIMLGSPAQAGVQIGDTTSGDHGIIYGDASTVLVGLWGVLDLVMDTATEAKKGRLTIRAWQDCDVAIRHGQAWAMGTPIV